MNILNALLDNVSFHSEESVRKWKFVCQRRIALEKEMSKYTLDYQEIWDLLKEFKLMNTMTNIGPCYEKLVKEFIVSLSCDCIKERNN